MRLWRGEGGGLRAAAVYWQALRLRISTLAQGRRRFLWPGERAGAQGRLTPSSERSSRPVPAVSSTDQTMICLSCPPLYRVFPSGLNLMGEMAEKVWGRKSVNKRWRGKGEGGGMFVQRGTLNPQLIPPNHMLTQGCRCP